MCVSMLTLTVHDLHSVCVLVAGAPVVSTKVLMGELPLAHGGTFRLVARVFTTHEPEAVACSLRMRPSSFCLSKLPAARGGVSCPAACP